MLLDQETYIQSVQLSFFTYKYLSYLAIQKSIKFSSLEEDILVELISR